MPAILYSYRRCPYAMRARMALSYSGVRVEIREISLKDKPSHMLQISPKGTVPVLALENGTVIDESLEIMHWALANNDPDDWLTRGNKISIETARQLISQNDLSFKKILDRYKYAIRFPEMSQDEYRTEGEQFLQSLELRLHENTYLLSDSLSITDIAIFPFIRQFASVDEAWFAKAPYPALRQWLERLSNSPLFVGVMQKYPTWYA
ncbi:MAG: glutathione S-transferase [Methylophilaceae bacterium]